MSVTFIYPPNPAILQWLSAGQLGNRLQRTVRLWVLLRRLYGGEWHWDSELPDIFCYRDLRDRLFSLDHPTSDLMSAENLGQNCQDSSCVCHRTLSQWVFQDGAQPQTDWCSLILQVSGITESELTSQLQNCPFATVHRSLRDDLQQLVDLGWLERVGRGQYRCLPAANWPQPPAETQLVLNFNQLSLSQTWELLRALESIAFIQPNLELVIRSLWEQTMSLGSGTQFWKSEPVQRIFVHLDYILPDEIQERVDGYQEQLEQLWHTTGAGVIQFQTWVARENRKAAVTVYPVCLHYVRRAKYLSAYGRDPDGKIGWHNYRLDRIASAKLTVLPWGDPGIPRELQELRYSGNLPTPEEVREELEAAWGFNFYLPRTLLLMRFPANFARWYVEDTIRHSTFKSVPQNQLKALVQREISDLQEQKEILHLLKTLSTRGEPSQFYRGWIRMGDINVTMRLRDWRPKGEVIAPLAMRHQMATEAKEELEHYD